jgi:hypothetical protein
MYTAALLALAPIAAQAAAQSARWPVFNLRANVTEAYVGAAGKDIDNREYWHNAPIGQSAPGEITGPLFDNSECSPARAGMNAHGKYLHLQSGNVRTPLIPGRSVLRALPLLLESHFNWQVRALGDDGRQQKQDEDCAKEPG